MVLRTPLHVCEAHLIGCVLMRRTRRFLREALRSAGAQAPCWGAGLSLALHRLSLPRQPHLLLLSGGGCAVQDAMAVDADELRREQRKLEEFWSSLEVLTGDVSAAALRCEQELRNGFARVRQLTNAREHAVLAQVADVVAERLATCRAQQDASTAAVADAGRVLAVAAAAERETDAYQVKRTLGGYSSTPTVPDACRQGFAGICCVHVGQSQSRERG